MRLLVIRSNVELGVKGRATMVIKSEKGIREKHIRDIDAVLVIGSNVKISSALPPVLSSFNIPLTIIAKDNIAILINPVVTRYNIYRRLQYQLDRARALEIALEYIRARVNGMVNILKYYKIEVPEVPEAPSVTSDVEDSEYRLRLWESQVSNLLWDKLVELIKPSLLEELRSRYGFLGRRPKHPDPFNKTLSVMYAVLYSLGTKALLAAGLDPTHGFLHRTRYSTPLTFDYVEMFKPVAIQATIDLINDEGLPHLAEDGELDRSFVNLSIKKLYEYLTLRHHKTGRSLYQYIFLKAYTLAKYLEGRQSIKKLTITWDRRSYK